MFSYPGPHHRQAFAEREACHPDAVARVEARMSLMYSECELGPLGTARAAGLSPADSHTATDTNAACPLPTEVLAEAARRATDAWTSQAFVPPNPPPPAPLPFPVRPPRGKPVLRVVGGTAA